MDALRIGSFVRSGTRWAANKWSKRSAASLRKRIEALEWFRNGLSSDKGLYLITLRFLLILLTSITAGLFVLASGLAMSDREDTKIGAGVLASIAFAGAFVAGVQGVRYASLDTREKIAKMVESLDKDIAKLKAKL